MSLLGLYLSSSRVLQHGEVRLKREIQDVADSFAALKGLEIAKLLLPKAMLVTVTVG